MASLPGRTKRRYPRYKYEAPVGIAILRGTTAVNVTGVCTVLGEGGAGVRTTEQLSVDEIVYVQIPLPHRPLRLPATVRYQHGPDYGVEFLALGATEREFIRSSCSSFPRVG
jgi:PilZ domain